MSNKIYKLTKVTKLFSPLDSNYTLYSNIIIKIKHKTLIKYNHLLFINSIPKLYK